MQPRDLTYRTTGTTIIGGIASGPSVALTYALADTGTAGVAAAGLISNTGSVASGTWSIPAVSGLTVTPSSGGAIAPSGTVVLSVTAASAGSYDSTLVCSGAAISGNPQTFVAAAAPAPAITLTALTGGNPVAGVAFNVQAVLSNPTTLPLTGTPENVTGTAVFSPATVGWSLGDLNKTFTATWAAAGPASIRATAPGGLVSNTLSFTVGSAPPPPPPSPPPPSPADFIDRRTGSEVVWWQGMDNDAEVTQFQRARDTNLAPMDLYREADATVGSCLVFKFLGSTLTADFLASGGNGPRPMVLSDASEWPTTFPFRFFVSKLPDLGPDKKTIFECSARSGNTLTVTYIPLGASEFESTPTIGIDRLIGDAAGGECPNWTRPFSALTGADNGKGTADPAASGTLPVRSRIIGNPNYVPQTTGLMGYGFCAHIDYHTDARFNPWVPSAQIPGTGDSVSRANPCDTTESWLQYRLWLSPDTQLINQVGGKVVGIQAETTVPQQIVMGVGPGSAFTIPDTPDTIPFALSKFNYGTYGSAGLAMAADAYNPNGSSYQHGSFDPVTGKSWQATAIYAASGLPATGQDTPDGSSAWEHKLGRWVTFMWHVKPGKNWHYEVDLKNTWVSSGGGSLTLIDAPDDWPTSAFQVQALENNVLIGTFDVATRSGAVLSGLTLASGSHGTFTTAGTIRKIPATPAGSDALSTEIEVYAADIDAAQFTRLLRLTNYPVNYGSNGQYTNRWYQSIPGFNAMDFWGYHNSELSQASAPRKTYLQKAAQMIFSKAYIPPPKPVWLGFSLPAAGTIGAAGSHTLYSIVSDTNERFSLQKVIGAWGSAALVRIRDVNGLLIDMLYVVFGGGHGDTGNDGVYGWRFSTQTWERVLAPSTQVVARLYAPAPANAFGEEDSGTVGRQASSHIYQTAKALDSGEGLGPAYVNMRALAVGSGAPATGQAHIVTVTGTPAAARYGAAQPFNASGGWVAAVKDKKRRKFMLFEADNGTRFMECDYTSMTPTWVERNQAARSGPGWGGYAQPCAVHDSKRDIYIANVAGGSGWAALDATAPTGSWVGLTTTGTGPNFTYGIGGSAGTALSHRRKNDTFIIPDISAFPPTGYFVLTPPTSGTWSSGTWTWSRVAFSGTSNYSNYTGTWESYERWQYVEELDALMVCPRADAAMEIWAL